MARVVVESDISSDGKLHYFVYLKHDTEKESYQKVEVLIHHTDEHGNKVELIQNVARDADTAPETVSARSTEVETESNTTRHADEATLPKTGEERSELATIFSMLVAALGVTGLVVTSRKRRVTVKRDRKDKKNGK